MSMPGMDGMPGMGGELQNLRRFGEIQFVPDFRFHLQNLSQDDLQNLITLKGAKDLYGKAKGTGLFNLEQDFDAYLMNLDNNPANDPWRNGMTDDQLMNLDRLTRALSPRGALQNLEQEPNLQNLDFRWAVIQGLAEDAFKGRPAYLQNLRQFGDIRPRYPKIRSLQNLELNPANDPWRNGMTDYQLMNMITLKGAKDLYGKAKGTGLFNLE